jgi:two-component system, OmpR family, sensor kinase
VNPLLCFIRARLQRRLFLWFGATILFTGIAVASVIGASEGGKGKWTRDFDRVRALADDRFGQVWEDAAARDELAQAVSRELEVTVVLEGADGQRVAAFGQDCASRPLTTPVRRDGRIVGAVSFCTDRYRPRPLNFFIPLLVTGILLWAASSAIASRLARPMGALARVAQQIGAGNFAARVKLGRHHYGEAAALAFTINDMAARIERHLAEQRELLATVSHELRTPLSRIRLLTEMSREKGGDHKTLDDLDREVMEIDALVGDLLASSRIDFAVLSLRPLSAVELAARALERAGVDAGALWVDDEGEGGDPGEPILVQGDPTLLGRALANLIDNAKKHGGGLSALRVRRTAGQVVFEAEDRGTGLPVGEEQRIFEPFYRRSEQGSLGLGLSLVKRIAEAHQGKAYAENREGGGAKVGIALPASLEPPLG